ncbi:MAG: 50S ribosomal protein L9 [Planctomycetota bacterium]|jgi:large subunit ribosomal protein L9
MKVILKEDVTNLGIMGDVVDVAAGYARNYLLPKNFAVDANEKNIKAFDHEKRIIQEKANKRRDTSKSVADAISAMTLTIKAKAGEEEKLFGSVTTMDIADALKAEGIELDKKRITLATAIKRLGEHEAEVRVDQDITASLKVLVEPEG